MGQEFVIPSPSPLLPFPIPTMFCIIIFTCLSIAATMHSDVYCVHSPLNLVLNHLQYVFSHSGNIDQSIWHINTGTASWAEERSCKCQHLLASSTYTIRNADVNIYFFFNSDLGVYNISSVLLSILKLLLTWKIGWKKLVYKLHLHCTHPPSLSGEIYTWTQYMVNVYYLLVHTVSCCNFQVVVVSSSWWDRVFMCLAESTVCAIGS